MRRFARRLVQMHHAAIICGALCYLRMQFDGLQ